MSDLPSSSSCRLSFCVHRSAPNPYHDYSGYNYDPNSKPYNDYQYYVVLPVGASVATFELTEGVVSRTITPTRARQLIANNGADPCVRVTVVWGYKRTSSFMGYGRHPPQVAEYPLMDLAIDHDLDSLVNGEDVMYGVRWPDHPDGVSVVMAMLEGGADVGMALGIAVERINEAVVDAALQHRPDPNASTAVGIQGCVGRMLEKGRRSDARAATCTRIFLKLVKRNPTLVSDDTRVGGICGRLAGSPGQEPAASVDEAFCDTLFDTPRPLQATSFASLVHAAIESGSVAAFKWLCRKNRAATMTYINSPRGGVAGGTPLHCIAFGRGRLPASQAIKNMQFIRQMLVLGASFESAVGQGLQRMDLVRDV
ncbi:unnamed protein product [Vitrella brassicaformis CCMP3155]|uniref:Uncharacterized protein n=2 Tax=Vitrella brassicaformis TaxID=1169539 RepID=A0A0G4GNP1_VITBC|nr:unnamed protein product [Vitrella brassicaformis CCMP3155]|eukprot:CEM31902.1 unnamed protein product [Vitrella brassicaformis CCMP3155]